MTCIKTETQHALPEIRFGATRFEERRLAASATCRYCEERLKKSTIQR